jgi:hypothetical protein
LTADEATPQTVAAAESMADSDDGTLIRLYVRVRVTYDSNNRVIRLATKCGLKLLFENSDNKNPLFS